MGQKDIAEKILIDYGMEQGKNLFEKEQNRKKQKAHYGRFWKQTRGYRPYGCKHSHEARLKEKYASDAKTLHNS